MDGRYRLRLATAADARALWHLECLAFGDPWSEASLREAVSGLWTFGLVAEALDGAVAGYLIGRELAGSGEVLNLAVAPEWRRQGMGRALLRRGLEQFIRRGAAEVFLEVRASNAAAQELYAAEGFTPLTIRKRYYRAPVEDALVMRRALGAEPDGAGQP